ncbi:PBECR2 nuclease fold domain-containing protein [Enterobacteriaceae bacterium ESL0689]|nr:PBECR2 nuclease fold domain-containing protein [Enterobacteriaceae bacterium ESL0689]
MTTADLNYGSLPFSEQIEFFRRKLALPTTGWTDIYNAEHDWAFVVAGANRNDLVTDLQQAVDNFIAEGRTLEEFRQQFSTIVDKYGWSYNGGFGWRTRVIYDTNLRSSYQAGRYAQLLVSRDTLPYWEYIHSDAVEHPRELHLFWDGLLLRWNNPWWEAHFPPNAWGCQCTVRGRSEAWLKRHNRKIDTAPETVLEERTIGQRSVNGPRSVQVPEGIDPSFEHAPGRSRLNSQVPAPRGAEPLSGNLSSLSSTGVPGVPYQLPVDALPPPRTASADRLLPTGLTDREYATRFLSEFGATLDQPVVYRDVVGEPLVIGSELFTARKTGQLKISKRGRERFLALLADTIRQPDEIWTRLEWNMVLKKAIIRRRYIARFDVEGKSTPALAVFESGTDGWSGVTTFAPDRKDTWSRYGWVSGFTGDQLRNNPDRRHSRDTLRVGVEVLAETARAIRLT